MSARRRALTRSLVVSGVVAILLLLIVGVNLDACAAGFRKVGPASAAVLFGMYLAASLLRGVRLHALMPAGVSLPRLVTVSFRHQLFATFLPFKTGEAALPILLKRHGVPMSRTVAVLVLARALDLLALLTVLSLAYLVARGALPPRIGGLGSILLVVWVAAAAFAGWILIGGRRVASTLRARVPPFLGRFGRAGAFAGRAFDAVVAATLEMRLVRVGRGLAISIAIWIGLGLFGGMMFDAVLGPRPPGVWIVLSMFLSLGMQIPIQGFAGIGTTEALVVVLLATVGVASDEALAAGVVVHAVQIAFCAVVGGLGFAGAARFGFETPPEPTPAGERPE